MCSLLKLCCFIQKAEIFSFAGATTKSLRTDLQQDVQFRNLDSTKVKQVFVLCGANDVDRVLRLPKHAQSEYLDSSRLRIDQSVLDNSRKDITAITQLLETENMNTQHHYRHTYGH